MCRSSPRAELALSGERTSAAVARDFVRRSGCPEHALDVLDDALLIISELVTNSVLHGGPPIVLAVECVEDRLRVFVRDGAPAVPAPRLAGETDESGRGLALVDLLTDTWGVEPVTDRHGTGKQVWFELRP